MSDDKFGIIRDSADAANDFEELRRRCDEDCYIYIKNYLDREKVLDARREIVNRLDKEGILDPDYPTMDAIAKPNSGYGFKPEMANGCVPLQELLYSGKVTDFYRQFYGENIRHYDYTWLRALGPGLGTNPHCDLPYMGRGTNKHMTCWMPYGDISFELGGLMILEGSHKRMDLLENYVFRDVDGYCENNESQVKKVVDDGGWSFTGTL